MRSRMSLLEPRMISTALTALALCAAANTVHAKGWDWKDSLPNLSKTDMALAKERARVTLAGEPLGTVVSWKNAKSGNAGTVQLIRTFEWEGNACRTVVHAFQLKGGDNQVWEATICNVKGAWKWPVPPKRL